MSEVGTAYYYYINEESKKIVYHNEPIGKVPDGYIFCGLSELPIKGAAGYYGKNQPGYSLINGDELKEEIKSDDNDDENERADIPAY